jgi:hypothetical protein
MLKTGIFMITVLICFSACKSHDAAITQSQINAKVDSLVAMKMDEISRQAMEDLDHRISIEVKAKADSIVQAYMLSSTNTTPPAQP